MTKKLLPTLISMVMAFVLLIMAAGCGTQNAKATDTKSLTEKTGEGAATSQEEKPTPITFTVRSVDPGKDWQLSDTPVGKKFVEKTGVDFKFQGSVGDIKENIALIIASGDMPDIVGCHYEVAPFIEADSIYELTDLIEKYAPNYKEKLGSNWNSMKWSKDDPGRYFLTSPEQYSESFEADNWFFLQHAVVIDQNYPQIKTLDQYEAAIKAYKEKYPTIDGKPTIGLSILCDTWRWMLSLTNPAMMAAGTQSSGEIYVDPATQKVTYRETLPQEKEYFQWLNKMYNEGLLDKESFTQTYDQYLAKVSTGRVLAMTDMGWEFAPGKQALTKDKKFERLYGCYPVVTKEGVVNSAFSGGRAYIVPAAGMVITKSCKNPERFLQFLDYLSTDEGTVLNYWGIEGTHYNVVDGKRVVVPSEMEQRLSDPDYSNKTGVGVLYGFLPYDNGVKDSSGQYITPFYKDTIIANYTDVDKQVLKAYGLTTWADWFAKPTDFPFRKNLSEASIVSRLPADSDASVIYTKLQDVVKKDIVRAIVAKPEAFDEEWDKFLKDMEKTGVDKFTEACEAVSKELLELWGVGK